MNPLEYFFGLPFLGQLLMVYLVVINVVTFFYYGIDKIKARLSKRRVSEAMLWLLATIGGSPGALLAMSYFRHKTKKASFQAGIVLILAVQIGLFFWWLNM
ncbi:DUF1294 domain-containing protein [Candidatus Nomurabacteria bacterium]|nr:DUF1294 domain-containing protein [Candidatus Nomurabacteria bacterium]